MKKYVGACAGLLLVAMPNTPLAAQSINPALNGHQNEARVSLALTMPLGHAADKRRTAPRVELIARSTRPDGILPIVARDEDRRWQERRIGFTLDGSDTFTINGAPLTKTEHRDGISTVGWVAIGLGTLVVATVLVADDLRDQEFL